MIPTIQILERLDLIGRIVEFIFVYTYLVELVDTSDLKSDSILEYRFKSGNEYFSPK